MKGHMSQILSSQRIGIFHVELANNHVLSPRAPSTCAPLPVNQQRLLGRLQGLNHGFKVIAKVCPDIKLFPVAKLTSKHFEHVAPMQLARQSNGLCYMLACISKIVQVSTQIGYLYRYPKWVAAIRLLCHEPLKIVILAKVDHSKCASSVLKPKGDRFAELLLHPYRAGSPLFFEASPFGTGKNERNNDGGNRADRAHSIPVHSIDILQRDALRVPSSTAATLLHGAFQRPCLIIHLSIPLWIGRHFAMGARKPLAARPQGVKDV